MVSRIIPVSEFAALRTSGPLRFLAAREVLVTVGAYDAEYIVCLIVFGSDGSIYVQCPKFPHENGVLTEAHFPVPNTPPHTINFDLKSGLTPHRVKYSHHVSGVVHFSQTGKETVRFERRSFALGTSMGRLFQLNVYQPWACASLGVTHIPKRRRILLQNRFRRALPEGVAVAAEWRRRSDIVDSIRPPGGTSGPIAEVTDASTGMQQQMWFVGQHDASPLQNHVLMIRCGEIPVPSGVEHPTVIFLGGWDPHEVPTVGQHVDHTGCLAFMYPGPISVLRERAKSDAFSADFETPST